MAKEKDKPEARFGSKVSNAPVTPNAGGYELRTATAKAGADKMAGQNAGGFELRAVQESGVH